MHRSFWNLVLSHRSLVQSTGSPSTVSPSEFRSRRILSETLFLSGPDTSHTQSRNVVRLLSDHFCILRKLSRAVFLSDASIGQFQYEAYLCLFGALLTDIFQVSLSPK